MPTDEPDPPSAPYATPPEPHPRVVSLHLKDGRQFPLLPVYVGVQPSRDRDVPQMMSTWRLFAHPDLSEDITLDTEEAESMSVLVDVLPPGSMVVLEMHGDAEAIVVPRHPG